VRGLLDLILRKIKNKTEMRLYHLTTKASKEEIKFFGKGHEALRDWGNLRPIAKHSRIVYEKWWDFFNNSKTNWYCTQPRISCMDNLKRWEISQELGRLVYYLDSQGNGLWSDQTPALLSFTTLPSDLIWICEADWLRKYHDHELDTLTAHIKFAESRLEVKDYKKQYKLPEFMVGNPIEHERLIWHPTPKIVPIELKTRPQHPQIVESTF
jgi:hypothetical protein